MSRFPRVLFVVAIACQTAVAEGRYSFRLPEGFSIERVAGPPEIQFPMFAALDDRGRLFVAESSGLDLYAELTNLTRKCRISVLEDRDGDGRYEHTRVFVDKLVFPLGLVWRDSRLFVCDPPVSSQGCDLSSEVPRRRKARRSVGTKDRLAECLARAVGLLAF